MNKSNQEVGDSVLLQEEPHHTFKDIRGKNITLRED